MKEAINIKNSMFINIYFDIETTQVKDSQKLK